MVVEKGWKSWELDERGTRMIARQEEKDQAVFRVGEPEEGLLRCTGQLAMDSDPERFQD